MYYTYILKLSNNDYYTGHSSNLKHRITAHKNGRVKATKNFLPIELVFYAAFKTDGLAINFENYLKSNSGFAFQNKRLVQQIVGRK